MKGNRKSSARSGRGAGALEPQDKPATLKDLLDADTIAGLKRKAEALQQEAADRERQRREQAEREREAERRRQDNDFEFLLNNSKQDWKSYK